MNIRKNNIGKLYLMIKLNNFKINKLMNLVKEKESGNQLIIISRIMIISTIRKNLNLNLK